MFAVDASEYDDPEESVTTLGSIYNKSESTPGTYWIVVFPYNAGGGSSIGDYDLDIWTNYTESCIDWYNPQNDWYEFTGMQIITCTTKLDRFSN